MSGKYQDYGYSVPEPGSGDAGRALAAEFVSIVAMTGDTKTVCDLGCGNGYLASQLGKAGFSVTGVDASETGIAVARRHYQSDRVDFICADFDSGPAAALLEGRRFDVVVSSDVIEHLYRPSTLIVAAARLLNPGGTLIVGTPYHGYLKNVAISALGAWDSHHAPNSDGGHIKFFSVRTLKQLLKHNGFVDTRFRFHGRVRWIAKNMICVAKKHGD